MKGIALSILIFVATGQVFGQHIQKLTVTGHVFDEPPTKQGSVEHEIQFKVNRMGDLVAKKQRIGMRKFKLNEKIIIEKARLETVLQWINSDKREFSLSELQLDYKTLMDNVGASKYKPNFEIKPNVIIELDSFELCKSYNSKRSISTGGYGISVIMVDNADNFYVYTFTSDDMGANALRFRDFAISYTLLNGKLPSDFSGVKHFATSQMTATVLFAISIIECEGFYYEEFKKKNPSRTAQENRMMAGWDFVKYLKEREN